MNEGNALLANEPEDYGSLTLRSGVSLSFRIDHDPEMMHSGNLEPEDWSWIQ